MSSKFKFVLSVAIAFIVTCNILLEKIFGRMRNVNIKTFVKKLMDFEKEIPNFMSLGRGLILFRMGFFGAAHGWR